MDKVTGIGGVFFKVKDPNAYKRWWADVLDLQPTDAYATVFGWTDVKAEVQGQTVWSPMSETTEYYGPGDQQMMINYRVHDLEAMLAQVANAGGEVIADRMDESYGKFGWGVDPDGNRFELWEPPVPEFVFEGEAAGSGLIQGIGGLFFKSPDPAALMDWYGRALGIHPNEDDARLFWTLDEAHQPAYFVWSAFEADSDYFDPGGADHMVNYRVANLDQALDLIRAAGGLVLSVVEEYVYGKFCWFADPDGVKVELWEPVPGIEARTEN